MRACLSANGTTAVTDGREVIRERMVFVPTTNAELRELRLRMIVLAYNDHGGNILAVERQLGIGRTTIYRVLRGAGLKRNSQIAASGTAARDTAEREA